MAGVPFRGTKAGTAKESGPLRLGLRDLPTTATAKAPYCPNSSQPKTGLRARRALFSVGEYPNGKLTWRSYIGRSVAGRWQGPKTSTGVAAPYAWSHSPGTKSHDPITQTGSAKCTTAGNSARNRSAPHPVALPAFSQLTPAKA